jgi:hypothetical protein
MISRFNSAYIPHQNISLDEGMIPWRGNLSFRVYSPDKPVKYGIKAYMVSDSSNGYVSKFKLYTGKSFGSVLQYSLMSDCEIIPIARISAM